MKEFAPIMDQIDERNYYAEMRSSIIKRSRVHYIADSEEEEESLSQEEQENNMEAENAFFSDAQNGNAEFAEESALDLSEVDPEVLQKAEEIYRRLQNEAEEDAQSKRDEWIEKLTRDKEDEDAYNKATGSYSGFYGQGEVSQETKDMATNILEEKKLDVDALLKQEGKTD
ncbi:MAG: hypothetical protein ACI39H_07430 [Lachnospiraceae bacterium]